MVIKSWSISGMSEDYETMCQRILWNALDYFNSKGTVVVNEKELDAFLAERITDFSDCTGAQYNFSLTHARYIFDNGYDAWYTALDKVRPERVPLEFEHVSN